MDDVSLTKTCYRCGRMGTRGFFKHALKSTETDTFWACDSHPACENRQYRAFMGLR